MPKKVTPPHGLIDAFAAELKKEELPKVTAFEVFEQEIASFNKAMKAHRETDGISLEIAPLEIRDQSANIYTITYVSDDEKKFLAIFKPSLDKKHHGAFLTSRDGGSDLSSPKPPKVVLLEPNKMITMVMMAVLENMTSKQKFAAAHALSGESKPDLTRSTLER